MTESELQFKTLIYAGNTILILLHEPGFVPDLVTAKMSSCRHFANMLAARIIKTIVITKKHMVHATKGHDSRTVLLSLSLSLYISLSLPHTKNKPILMNSTDDYAEKLI